MLAIAGLMENEYISAILAYHMISIAMTITIPVVIFIAMHVMMVMNLEDRKIEQEMQDQPARDEL